MSKFDDFYDGKVMVAKPEVIEGVQRKADGSFLIKYNGYPYHATLLETPSVYEKVLKLIETGIQVLDYVESQPSLSDIESAERFWRDRQINTLRWLRERHRDELEQQAQTSLTSEQFSELLTYVQQLRDWPQSPAFPDSGQRPSAPAWFSALLS